MKLYFCHLVQRGQHTEHTCDGKSAGITKMQDSEQIKLKASREQKKDLCPCKPTSEFTDSDPSDFLLHDTFQTRKFQ